MKALLPLALVLLCLPVSASAQCDPTFDDVLRYGLPEEPSSVVAGDFDGDARPDVAAMGNPARAVTLLLNRGSGFVHESIALPHEGAVLLGIQDDELIAVGGAGITRIAARKATTTTVPGDALTNVAAAGDLNADNIADVAAVASRVSGTATVRTLRIFLGRSDGTFAEHGTAIALTAGATFDLEIADFTGDRVADLILADNRTGSLFEGNGDGTFKASRPLHPSLSALRRISIGDFDNDGRDDVLAGTTLLLAADPATRRPTNTAGYPVDLDRDGKLDLFSFSNIYRGNGDGTLTLAALMSEAGPASHSAVFADFDRDGQIDVAAATAWSDVAIHYGRGAMRFDGPSWGRSGSPYGGMATGDFNGDGRADIASASLVETVVYLGQADGTLAFTSRLAPAQAVAAADFDGDGKVDLHLVGAGRATGNGDGTFNGPSGGSVSATSAVVTTADLNGDDRPDIVEAIGQDTSGGGSGTVIFRTNDGAGNFTGVQVSSLPPLRAVTAADFNGDGLDDVVVAASRNYGPATLYLFDGRARETPVQLTSGVQPETVKAGDVDGDGRPDLVAVSAPNDELLIFPGNGNGTFRAPRRINVPDSAMGAGVTLGDFNGDGRTDITVATDALWEVLLFIQQGDGSFVETAHAPSLWYGETAADVDGDGRLDLVLDDELSGRFRVALNRCRQELHPMPPVVRLVSNGASSEGSAASFIAELDPGATGTVMFYKWATNRLNGIAAPVAIGSAVISNGRATLHTTTLTRGTHEIHAVYLGDGPFMRSRSGTIEHTVTAPAAGGKRRAARH